ncbi:MAG: exodeoxyribonuclease VII small subunit [Pirellulales bacterium]|jgi:exodeoxyribonuclease VII small subunit
MAKKSASKAGDASADDPLASLSYEHKEARLDEILVRLDNSETPMDELASEAREAAALIMSMHATLKATRQEITTVFEELERHKEAIAEAAAEDEPASTTEGGG